MTDLMAQHPHPAVLLLKGLVTRVRQLEAEVGPH
jgi:CRP/FNR family cyclic AMP-dependent transcriptional regulator